MNKRDRYLFYTAIQLAVMLGFWLIDFSLSSILIGQLVGWVFYIGLQGDLRPIYYLGAARRHLKTRRLHRLQGRQQQLRSRFKRLSGNPPDALMWSSDPQVVAVMLVLWREYGYSYPVEREIPMLQCPQCLTVTPAPLEVTKYGIRRNAGRFKRCPNPECRYHRERHDINYSHNMHCSLWDHLYKDIPSPSEDDLSKDWMHE